MRKFLIPVIFSILLFSQCKKDNNGSTPTTSTVKPAINSIAVDNQKNIWFATDSGLYKYNNTDWTRYELPIVVQKINSLDIKNDTLLLSTPAGALLLKIEVTGISVIDQYNTIVTPIISDTVNVAGFDPYNNTWFGTYVGLSMLNGTQWSSNTKINYQLISHYDKISCAAFRQNDFFFGTYGKSLWHLNYNKDIDAVSGASRMIQDLNGAYTTDTIFSLYAASDSSIWIGSTAGLTRNIGSTHKDIGDFQYFLGGERVHSIIESSDGRMWAGTENGIYVKEGTVWTNYTKTDGLADNFVLSLAEDKDSGIWIWTKKGPSLYKSGTFTNYNLHK